MRVMDQPITDRIGDAGFADGGVPGGRRQLTGNQRRGPFTPIFQDLEQIPPLGVGERREEPIIDGEQIELGEFGEQPSIRAVAATDGEVVQQPRRPDVGRGEAMATGAFHKRRRQPRLADAGRPGDQEVMVIADPPAGAETQDDLAREAARRLKSISSSDAG